MLVKNAHQSLKLTQREIQIIIFLNQSKSPQNVEKLQNGFVYPGKHRIIWDAKDVTSGIYLVKMTAGAFVDNQKIVLIK